MTNPSNDPQRPPKGPASGSRSRSPQHARDLTTIIFGTPATPPELQDAAQLVNTLQLVDAELGRRNARAARLQRKAAKANTRRAELEAECAQLAKRAALAEQRAEAAERRLEVAERDAQAQVQVLAGNLAAMAGERNDVQARLTQLRAAGVDTAAPRATGGPVDPKGLYFVGEPGSGCVIRTSPGTPRREVDAAGARTIAEPWPFKPGDVVDDSDGAVTEHLLAAPEGTTVTDAAGYDWTRAGKIGLWHTGVATRSTSAGLAHLGPLVVVSVGRARSAVDERIAAHGARMTRQLHRVLGVPAWFIQP